MGIQLINMGLLLFIIYGLFVLTVGIPRRLKYMDEKIDLLQQSIDEIKSEIRNIRE